MLVLVASPSRAAPAARGDSPEAQLSQWVNDLAGPDAVADARAAQNILKVGDPAVAPLAQLAANGQSLAPRLIAIELLGQIATPRAIDVLLQLLAQEKNLAVRGQVCIQLGYARERRALPIITQWLQTIGPKALDDVPGPKEAQPSTCYIRHIEALGMIGDERAVPILQQFIAKIPPGIGYGGFVSNFVKQAAQEAIEEIREQAVFWAAVRGQPGLEQKIAPLFAHIRRDRLARFRLHEDQIIRRTEQAKSILQLLSSHPDPAVSSAAKNLLAQWQTLAP
jgi:HEAT repeat protein